MSEKVVTVVQHLPEGTAVTQGKASDAAVKEAIALGEDTDNAVVVEVIRDTPEAAVHPAARVSDTADEPVESARTDAGADDATRREPAERDTRQAEPATPRRDASKPAPKPSAEARSAFGPVGPDPEQEAARAISVPKGPTGPKRSTAPTGPTGVKPPTGPTGARR